MKRPALPVQQRLDVGNRAGAADTALHNTCNLFQKSSFCAPLLWSGDVIKRFFEMQLAKIDFLIVMHFQSLIFGNYTSYKANFFFKSYRS